MYLFSLTAWLTCLGLVFSTFTILCWFTLGLRLAMAVSFFVSTMITPVIMILSVPFQFGLGAWTYPIIFINGGLLMILFITRLFTSPNKQVYMALTQNRYDTNINDGQIVTIERPREY